MERLYIANRFIQRVGRGHHATNTLGWRNHKLQSRLLGDVSATSYMHRRPLYWQKVRGTKELPDESERGERKSRLRASSPITSWSIKGDQVEAVTDFIISGS